MIHPALGAAACVALFTAEFALLFVLSGVPTASVAWMLGYAVFYYLIPGFALLAASRWLHGDRLLATVWAMAAGIAAQPVWLTPLWMGDAIGAAWLVPTAAIVVLLLRRKHLLGFLRSGPGDSGTGARLATVGGVGLLVAFSAWLGVMHPFATAPIDPHFATQGSIVRNLRDGWPPMNQLLEGAPLSYNYALHLGLLHLTEFAPLGILEAVSRIAPIFFLQVVILVFTAFARGVLGLEWRYVALATASAFWAVGYGPVNAAIFGAVLPSAATFVVSSLGAFIVFFVALRFLAERMEGPQWGWRDALVVMALAFSMTGLRGPSGAILVCVVAFMLLLRSIRQREADARGGAALAAALAGMGVALLIFFTLGSGFSGTSFIEVGTTFTWLADQNAFQVVESLERGGASAWLAGAAGFAVIALMQAKFLFPTFVYQCASMRSGASPAALLLLGAAIAGICGTMLTTAPGGSHFSFIHYAALSMSLLGALGLARLLRSQDSSPNPSRRRLRAPILVLVLVTAAAGLHDLVHQLRRFGRENALFAGPPQLHAMPQLEPLVARVPDGTLLLPILRPADRVRGLEAEWGMLHGVRFLFYGNLLREYEGWKNRLQPTLERRLQAASALELVVAAGTLRDSDLEAFVATLSRPAAMLYVIAPADLEVTGPGRPREVARTTSYVLYSYGAADGAGRR